MLSTSHHLKDIPEDGGVSTCDDNNNNNNNNNNMMLTLSSHHPERQQQQQQQQFLTFPNDTNTLVSSLSGHSMDFYDNGSLNSSNHNNNHHHHNNNSRRRRNRLNLDNEFHGRREEIKILQDTLNKTSQESQLVWISGASGVGKTSVVVEALRHTLPTHNNNNSNNSNSTFSLSSAYFVMGKFDPTRQRCEPYSALLESFMELCDLIVQDNLVFPTAIPNNNNNNNNNNNGTDPQQDEQEQEPNAPPPTNARLDAEVRLLTKLITKLSTLEHQPQQPQQSQNNDHNHEDNDNNNNNASSSAAAVSTAKKTAFTRFKLMCRTFLRSVSRQKPVVLFLDDLQWADEGSLKILEGLVTDPDKSSSSTRVLLVGAYRQEELHNNPLLVDLVRATTTPTTTTTMTTTMETGYTIYHNSQEMDVPSGGGSNRTIVQYMPTTLLTIGCLGVDSLNSLIVSLTGAHQHHHNNADANDNGNQTEELAKIIWNKTHGNAFFVTQFLEMLVDRGLLYVAEDNNSKKQGTQPSSSVASLETPSRGGSTSGGAVVGGGGQQGGAMSRSKSSTASDTRPFYQWDIERIQRETNVCENVADLVEAKIQRQPRSVQAVLKMAACLGYTIHLEVLYEVLRDQRKPKDENNNNNKTLNRAKSSITWTRDDLQLVLAVACREGLVEESHHHNINNGDLERIYKFSHDRIQSVLYALIPEGEERELLHLRIGKRLFKNITSTKGEEGYKKEDWLVSMTADHLNRGVRHLEQERERVDLMRFNLHVGKITSSKSAFLPASEYLEFGLGLFDEEYLWTNHYDLVLDLLSTLSEVYHCAGNFPRSKEIIENIISRTHVLSDRLRAYYLLVESLGAEGRGDDARALAFTVLKELGQAFPKNPNKLHVVRELIRVKLALKGRPPKSLCNLPTMRKPVIHAAMTLMSHIATHTFMSDTYKNTFSLVGLRLMRLTVEHGMDDWSPTGIACYAIVLVAIGQIKEALAFGEAACLMSEKLGKRPNDARHVMYLEQLVNHWRRRLVDGLETFPKCYDLAMQNGDIDTGLCATAGYIGTACHCGKTLEEFEESCRLFVQQMNEYDHQTYLGINVPMWQLSLNMLGRNENLLLLSGEAMDLRHFHAVVTAQNHALSLLLVDYFHLILATHFLAYDRMIELLPRLERGKPVVKTHWAEYHMAFTMGMAYFALYGKFRNGRHRRAASRIVNRFRRWVDADVLNAQPFHSLLSALKTSFAKKGRNFDSTQKMFDSAIRLFNEGGWICYEGVSCEHAALFADQWGRREAAGKYMLRSVEIQEEYGYEPKVEWLRGRYGGMMEARIRDPRHSMNIEIPPTTIELDDL